MDVSDIFIFFPVPGRGKGRRRPRRWPGGGGGLNENRGKEGGLCEEAAREREGRRGNVCGEGGGGAKYVFFGAEMPTKLLISVKCLLVVC